MQQHKEQKYEIAVQNGSFMSQLDTQILLSKVHDVLNAKSAEDTVTQLQALMELSQLMFEEIESEMPAEPCHKDDLSFHDARGS